MLFRSLTAAGIDNVDKLTSEAGTIGEKVTNWLAGAAGWKKPGELMIKSNFKKGTGYYPEYNAQLETYVVPLRFYYYKINKGEINNG